MKTKIKVLLALVAGLMISSFTPAKAQCPYGIDNQLNCPVTVDITIYKPTGTSCNVVCASYTGITIPQGTFYSIRCNGCNVCNIEVTITDIGGTPVSPGTADFSTQWPSYLPLGGGGCASNGIVYAPGAIAGGGVFKVF